MSFKHKVCTLSQDYDFPYVLVVGRRPRSYKLCLLCIRPINLWQELNWSKDNIYFCRYVANNVLRWHRLAPIGFASINLIFLFFSALSNNRYCHNTFRFSLSLGTEYSPNSFARSIRIPFSSRHTIFYFNKHRKHQFPMHFDHRH